MRSRWDESTAGACTGDLELRAYSSRLLGADPELVLHGGGNTSVKTVECDVFGDDVEALWVKGSGWDLATIEPQGFAPVRLEALRRLVALPALSDTAMARELRAATIDPAAPAPSVEALLHAVLPQRWVDHTHADAVLALTNTPGGLDLVREVYGERVVLVAYVMPGFELARACARALGEQASAATTGIVLANHGVFSFGDTARESYERMIELVTLAEEALAARGAPWPAPASQAAPVACPPGQRVEVARLRRAVSRCAGHPLLLGRARDESSHTSAREEAAASLSQRGPATPDHVLRTRRLPLVGRDVDAWAEACRREFERNAGRSPQPLVMLDPAPRVVLDPELGALHAARTAREMAICDDIYRHTVRIVAAAERLGGYRALPEADIFDVEYWELEQAKLKRQGRPPPLAGEVALVTGAASGIGRACVEALLAEGAAVVGVDVNPAVGSVAESHAYHGVEADVTDAGAVGRVLDEAAGRFGGLDMLVCNAGVVPESAPVAGTAMAEWRRTMTVNLDSNVMVLGEAHAMLTEAPARGRVVVVGSKNVAAPGPGLAAYSASKAALTQLARVTALEWAPDGISVNVVHPDAVFDTGVWTPEVLEQRAGRYGLTVEEYKRRNLLGVEISSADVAALVVALLGPVFARTTGAQVPIDGGNDRVV